MLCSILSRAGERDRSSIALGNKEVTERSHAQKKQQALMAACALCQVEVIKTVVSFFFFFFFGERGKRNEQKSATTRK